MGIVVLIASALVSVACAVHLWRQPGSAPRKLWWTAVIAIPAIGPLLYGGMYEAPPALPEHEQGVTEYTPAGIGDDTAHM